jgi:O-antigen biosynthesis protein
MLALAHKSVDQESPIHERIVRWHLVPGDDLDSANARLLSLVGHGKRILSLGTANASLGRGLRAQGCEIVPVHDIDATSSNVGAVNTGGLSQLGEAAVGTFDVVLAAGSLEQLSDPLAVLKEVKKYLRREGYLVVAVPNVAHGDIRLALLNGQFPTCNVRAYQEAPQRFFTYDSMVRLLEEAEFAIAAVERHEQEVNVPDEVTAITTPELLESINQAPEAKTAQFMAVAYPLPWRGLEWLQMQLRTVTAQYTAAKREVHETREDFESVNNHMRLLLEQVEGFHRREKELRAQMQKLADQRSALISVTDWLRRSMLGRAYRFTRRLFKRRPG